MGSGYRIKRSLWRPACCFLPNGRAHQRPVATYTQNQENTKIQKDHPRGLSADCEDQDAELENRAVLMEIARVTEEELVAINAKLNGTIQ